MEQTAHTSRSRPYQVLEGAALGALQNPQEALANDVLLGLSERPRRLPSHLFYDDNGSRLFAQIMEQPEYYLPNCEAEILISHGRAIMEPATEGPVNIVDLGAGNGAKTMLLLKHGLQMGADIRYVPIDISEEAVREVCHQVRSQLPEVPLHGLVCTYDDGLRWLAQEDSGRQNMLLFLGSNIGNFNGAGARSFLRSMWNSLSDQDWLVIGFDLRKDIGILQRAYSDSQCVTRDFNLNLLHRINRELGGHFDVKQFEHYATYDVQAGAMMSYLVSRIRQEVHIDALQRSFEFLPWEPIHTECSYKFLPADIASLAKDTGFAPQRTFHDTRQWFSECLWRVKKEPH